MNKSLCKIEMFLLKIIPTVLALITCIQTILSIFGISITFLTQLAFVSYIPLLFFYISSYTFDYCGYHRIPMHYLLMINIINTVNIYYPIPEGISTIVSMIFLFVMIGGWVIRLYNKKHGDW